MIQIEHLKKVFDDDTIPLKDITVTINDGDVISIIGPSGTGKSTLLRCINMLSEPTSGRIIVDGQDITRKGCNLNAIRKKMGMVFQSFNLFGHLTIIENIMNPQITLLGRSRQEAYDKAMQLLQQVGLASKVLNYPDELSGGQQQRIAIARTLAMDPDIILFDEPTSALDPSMIGEVQSVIKMLAKTGRTMMIVTHEMDFARKISNRILFMHDGYILEDGTPRQIFEHPKHEITKRFIQRLSTLTYRLDFPHFDMEAMGEELNAYGEKLLIEAERLSKLMLAFEEICMNNLMAEERDHNILVKVEYSEKLDTLTMLIYYKGEAYDVTTSQNTLFISLLAEPTTELHQNDIKADPMGYEHMISMRFKWQEEDEE